MAYATDQKWSMSSQQAQEYMINPLIAPEPSEETGLNAHYRSTFSKVPEPGVQRPADSPTPPSFPVRGPPTPISPHSKRRSVGTPPSASPTMLGSLSPSSSPGNKMMSRSRGSSMSERQMGDSQKPLNVLKGDQRRQSKSSRHRRHSSLVDQIDALDIVPGGGYHHEGPFDATLLARNLHYETSPVAAVKLTNEAALKSTPVEKIRDALEKHIPLDGFADVPPGAQDPMGRTFDYRETNLMKEEGGNLGREYTLGEKYDPNPDVEQYKDNVYEIKNGVTKQGVSNTTGIELPERRKKSVDIGVDELEGHSSHHKRNSLTEGLKRRIGSLRKKKD